jgi:hypothetical protein
VRRRLICSVCVWASFICAQRTVESLSMQRGAPIYLGVQEPPSTGPRMPNYVLGGGVYSCGTVAHLKERTRASARNAEQAHINSPFVAPNGLRDPERLALIWADRGPAKDAFGPPIRRAVCDGRCRGDLPARRARSRVFRGFFRLLGDRRRSEPLDDASEGHHTREVRPSCEHDAGPPGVGLLPLSDPGGREPPGSVAEPPEVVARHNKDCPRAAPVLPGAAGNASGDATRGATRGRS